MSKETPELIAECWQLLVDYIPRRDIAGAAEQLYSYLYTVLDKEELAAIAELDSYLSDAGIVVEEENAQADDYEDEYDDED